MIHSLVGQSEILTIVGAYFVTSNNIVTGSIFIGLGIIGSLVRYSMNVNIMTSQTNKVELDHEEKLSRIITELSEKK